MKEKLNNKNNEDKRILRQIDEYKNLLYQCYKEMNVEEEKKKIDKTERIIKKFVKIYFPKNWIISRFLI